MGTQPEKSKPTQKEANVSKEVEVAASEDGTFYEADDLDADLQETLFKLSEAHIPTAKTATKSRMEEFHNFKSLLMGQIQEVDQAIETELHYRQTRELSVSNEDEPKVSKKSPNFYKPQVTFRTTPDIIENSGGGESYTLGINDTQVRPVTNLSQVGVNNLSSKSIQDNSGPKQLLKKELNITGINFLKDKISWFFVMPGDVYAYLSTVGETDHRWKRAKKFSRRSID